MLNGACTRGTLGKRTLYAVLYIDPIKLSGTLLDCILRESCFSAWPSD